MLKKLNFFVSLEDPNFTNLSSPDELDTNSSGDELDDPPSYSFSDDESSSDIEVIQSVRSRMSMIPASMCRGDTIISEARDMFTSNLGLFRGLGMNIASVCNSELGENEKTDIVDEALSIVSLILRASDLDFSPSLE
jgi:hypothetical protein